MKTEEIYAIVADESGWRKLPNGSRVTLGYYVTLGDGVKLGDRVALGDYVRLGNFVALGNDVTLGNGVKLGDGVTLGEGVTYTVTPIQVQCHPYVVYPFSKTEIGVGCVVHPIEYWMKADDPVELADHPECQPWSTYREAIALVAEFMGK